MHWHYLPSLNVVGSIKHIAHRREHIADRSPAPLQYAMSLDGLFLTGEQPLPQTLWDRYFRGDDQKAVFVATELGAASMGLAKKPSRRGTRRNPAVLPNTCAAH
jgi:hypothetical protein